MDEQEQQYREGAHKLMLEWFEEDDISVTDESPVSLEPDEGGAWVTVKVWVSDHNKP